MVQTVSALAITGVIVVAFAASVLLAVILGLLTEIIRWRPAAPIEPEAAADLPGLFPVPSQRTPGSASTGRARR